MVLIWFHAIKFAPMKCADWSQFSVFRCELLSLTIFVIGGELCC